MSEARGRDKLPRMDPNVLIFFALEGYAVAAALILIALLTARRDAGPAD
jgi:hypothetical protein